MFILNQFKKTLFIYLIAFLGISHFAYAGGEISGHFGKKFQTDGAWHFGADALYRLSIDENSSFGIGPRYRFYFKSSEDNSVKASLNKHRIALLTNYRYEMMEGLFVGAIAGIDIWKRYSSTSNNNTEDNKSDDPTITSSEFLWNNFTAQLGIEVGYKITPNFLIKLESGYDLLSFKKCINRTGSDDDNDSKVDCGDATKFNGVYATVGVGYHF